MVDAISPQRTVMVVEDEPAIRGLLSLTLEAEDYRVESAGDGQEALDLLQHRRPDVILLDLMLPTMDGKALIDILDRDTKSKEIPIIAVSAGERYLHVGEQGVHAFLSKPFDLDTLLVVLHDVLQHAACSH
jgi:two-component system response regulator MprA